MSIDELLGEITMHVKYIILILLLTCACGIVHGAEEETDQEQDLIKSAETAKESLNEAFSEMGNAFDATKRALSAIFKALSDIWSTINFSDIWGTATNAFSFVQDTLEAVLVRIDQTYITTAPIIEG